MSHGRADSLRAGGAVLNGRYHLERIIGQGGMGTVFAAVDHTTGRKVAVKRLLKKHLGNKEIRDRFRREARIAQTLKHPGICSVLYTDEDEDGVPYIVMPLLRGKNLAAVIHETETPSIHYLAGIIDSVLTTLAFAHERGVLHRDIKPNNIFIGCSPTGTPETTLLDFGISKIVGVPHFSSITTAAGTVLGTPHYMSPEQIRGAQNVDIRTDLYAVGILLYEAFTKKRPFEGDGYNDVIIKIVSEPFVPPSQHNSDISGKIEVVILKALSRHPDDRFGSAEEMRAALREAVASSTDASNRRWDTETTAHDIGGDICFSSQPVFFRKQRQRGRWIVGIIGTVLLITVVLWGVSSTALPARADDTEGERASPMSEVRESPVTEFNVPKLQPPRRPLFHENETLDAPARASENDRTPTGTKKKRGPLFRPQRNAALDRAEPPTSAQSEAPPASINGRLGTKVVSTF